MDKVNGDKLNNDLLLSLIIGSFVLWGDIPEDVESCFYNRFDEIEKAYKHNKNYAIISLLLESKNLNNELLKIEILLKLIEILSEHKLYNNENTSL